MERRGRIPVATFRTPEGKTRSRSRVRDPNYNKSDPDTDLFTLLEDNIAMKEENESLSNKYNACIKEKETLEKDNNTLKAQVKDLHNQQGSLKSQIIDLNHKLNLVTEEKMSIKSLQNENIQKVRALSAQLDELRKGQKDYLHIIEMNKKFKEQVDALIPVVTTNEFESLIDTPKDANNFIAIECIEKVLTEFSQLKITLNVAELQLYEANEKVSELMENQNHLEKEIESLREENSNLTRVAELMTKNMKESVTTTKKLEEALLHMKRRNEELQKRNFDALDSPTKKRDSVQNEEIIRLRDEITKRDLAHGERIVEMKRLIDTTLENSNNEEMKELRLRLDLLEKELKDVTERAEKAEAELNDIKRTSIDISTYHDGIENDNSYSDKFNNNNNSRIKTSPEKKEFSICNNCKCKVSLKTNNSLKETQSTLPPPPPPPLPKFNFPSKITSTNSIRNKSSFNDSIASYNLKSGSNGKGDDTTIGGINDSQLRKQQVKATGLDALVRELKDGNVTLRRARRKTRTNQALQEMFEVLEISRQQNRNSKILIESHMSSIDIPTTDF